LHYTRLPASGLWGARNRAQSPPRRIGRYFFSFCDLTYGSIGPLRLLTKNRLGNPDTADSRALLAERSPLNHLERATRPILIAQGLNDVRRGGGGIAADGGCIEAPERAGDLHHFSRRRPRLRTARQSTPKALRLHSFFKSPIPLSDRDAIPPSRPEMKRAPCANARQGWPSGHRTAARP
jgi:hypothetical protein